jgi:hypothetical protein
MIVLNVCVYYKDINLWCRGPLSAAEKLSSKRLQVGRWLFSGSVVSDLLLSNK